MFYYLYLYVDVWSRKIVGCRVEEVENGTFASSLLQDLCKKAGVDATALVVHQDNGAPMKGATFKATMDKLGVTSSYSRPHVSDDNPFSESLFRTLKYHPSYPRKPFADLDAARTWVTAFVDWYNNVHLHSTIGFVTPSARHDGIAEAILQRRRRVYALAKKRLPQRWARATRTWENPAVVRLNPPKTRTVHEAPLDAAA
jgi:transposase InsO family protein